MCVIFFYTNSNPNPGGYKLILASNRDEFFARNTSPAAKWPNAEHVYGGIDLEPGREGGTWLAISGQNGVFKVGALLNLTGEPKPRDAAVHNNNIMQASKCVNGNRTVSLQKIPHNSQPQTATKYTDNHLLLGRGMIVADYVRSAATEDDIAHYNERLVADCTKYSAFNFVSIEIGAKTMPARVKLLSNVPPTLATFEERKCYGFGNSLPDAPFVKVRFGQERFSQLVTKYHSSEMKTQNESELINGLMDLLKCRTSHWPDPELERRAPNWGEDLSALNVRIPRYGYGSRTHTVILIDDSNKMTFYEETMDGDNPDGKWNCQRIEKNFTF